MTVIRKKETMQLSILDCMRMADQAWKDVTQKTNRFRKAALRKKQKIKSDKEKHC